MASLEMSQTFLTIIIVIITYLIIYLYRFYAQLKRYPPGPTPLPILGNLLLLRKSDNTMHPFLKFMDVSRDYGKVLTFWMGSNPVVIIFDRDVGRETYAKNQFAGRYSTSLDAMVSCKEYKSFLFMDYGSPVRHLRRVSYEAIRKLIAGNNLPKIIDEIVTDMVNTIKSTENEKPFKPIGYVTKIFVRIIGGLTFGKIYSDDDSELNYISDTVTGFNSIIVNMLATDLAPVTKLVLGNYTQKYSEINLIGQLIKRYFEKSRQTYRAGSCDNFCDSLITAKNVAIEEGKEAASDLNDMNLAGALHGLFIAGIDTSIQTFLWMIVYMSYYPEVQNMLREEIKNIIGDRLPESEHKIHCHYTMAFICETLRIRNVVAIGVFHKTMVDTKIGEYNVPKGTCVVLHQYSILNDPDYWQNPHQFSPERFLDSSGQFMATNIPEYMPFSTGQRKCVGEKFAMESLFLTLTLLVQRTEGYQFEFPDGTNSDYLTPAKTGFVLNTKPFSVVLKKINNRV